MVNPGAFRGSRKEFLLGVKQEYAEAVADGCAGEAVALIQRRYFKRYPVDLPHDAEPSAEQLAAVDDDAIDPDYEEPNAEKMSPDEYAIALAKLENRQKTLEFRKAQIKRWLAYQYMKDHDLDPKDTGANNPFHTLHFKLTGKDPNRPRHKNACNIWRQTHREIIEAKVKTMAAALNVDRLGLAPLREKVARDLFLQLSGDEQQRWRMRAQNDHAAAIAAWKEEMGKPASTKPEDRQRCIMALVRFVQPILDMICETTGWKATLITGGPEPAHEGRLNIISVHSGTTSGDVPMNFGRAERVRFQKQIVPIYGSFLQKCYSPDECRSRALNREETGFMSMETLGLDSENANLDCVGVAPPSLPATTPSEPSDAAGASQPPASLSHTSPAQAAGGESSSTRATSSDQVETPAAAARAISPDHVKPPAPASRPHSPPLSRPSSPVCSPANPPQDMPGSSPPSSFPPQAAQADTSNSDAVNPPSTTSPAQTAGAGTLNSHAVLSAPATAAVVPTATATTPSSGGADATPTGTRRRPSKTARTELASACATGPTPKPITRGKKRGLDESNGPLVKKARTSKGASSSTTSSNSVEPAVVEPAEDAPKWFQNALTMLQDEKLRGDPQWMELVRAWSAFESQENYHGESKLKSKYRPGVIGDWIQRARSPTWRPNIVDAQQYAVEYMQWWSSVQPEWRISSDGNIVFEGVEGDWGVLRRPGVNGLVSVLAALFYWGLAATAKEDTRGAWADAVADCLTACRRLLTSV